MKSKTQHTKVFLLKKTKYSESDLILQGLSPELGKMNLMAKGALKSKKRFSGGVLEPTHQLNISFSQSNPNSHFYYIDEATVINDFAKLRTDYEKLETALKVIESVNKVSQENDPHSIDLYNLLGHSLKRIEDESDLIDFNVHYMIRLLQIQGVLDVEQWMKPFVQNPIAIKVDSFHRPDKSKTSWLISQFENYLVKAEN